MPDLVDLFRRQQLHERIYAKRMAAIDSRELVLRRENALREEIERNMKDLVATSLQCRYRGWQGRCIAAHVRLRHFSAIAIQRIVRGFLGRRCASRERRKLRQVLHSPVALKLLLERSRVVRTISNWQELLDSHTNEYFYFHVFTHDSQWLPPESFQEFLHCKWPDCEFLARTMHEIHEHYRTLHVWFCPVCMAKVCTSTFPQCPVCLSICSHDPETGEILGPGETQLQAIHQHKQAEEELRQQKEQMLQHRMMYWAELAAQEEASYGKSRPKKKRVGFASSVASSPGKGGSHATAAAPANPVPKVSEDDSIVEAIKDLDASVLQVKWIASFQRSTKQSKVFAKALLPLGSLYVGDFTASDRNFDGMGEILYANGDRYAGQWEKNIRAGQGIYQSADGNEYIGLWLDGKKHGWGIQTLATGERYCGQFEQGKRHGMGVLHAANGDRYQGQFANNRPSGQGKFKKVNGDRFLGTTTDGQAHGVGILSTAHGEVYKGQWENGFRHHSGVCFYPNGTVYSGEWWHGRWSGAGVYISSEGIKYIGRFENGERHGPGKLIFDNGDIFDGHFFHNAAHGKGSTKGIYRFHDSGNMYIGGWAGNKRHGRGTYIFRDGSQFSGHFHQDHAEGRGSMQYANGNVYKGEFLKAEKHGQGVYEWQNGSIYEGQFQNGLIQGFGKLAYASGHRYEGNWARNKKHGWGTFFYRHGDTYQGEWWEDHRHGKGKFTWNPGTSLQESYDGVWDMDRRHGLGLYTYADGTIYEGDWMDGTREGIGEFRWPNGDVYRGQFEQEMQHGFGSFFCQATGDMYEGSWVLNVREGPGKLLYASGKVFEGAFHEGQRHGAGVMTYPDGNSYHGLWDRDKKQGGGRYVMHVSGESRSSSDDKGTINVRVFGY